MNSDAKVHLLYMVGGLLLLGGGALASSQGVPSDVVGVLLGAGGSLLPTSFIGGLLGKGNGSSSTPTPTPVSKPPASITPIVPPSPGA